MDDPEGQGARPSDKQRRRLAMAKAYAAKRASEAALEKAVGWAARGTRSIQGRLRAQIEAIRKNATHRTIEVSSVKFEGAVRRDVEEHCGFFDYGPLTKFLTDSFHLAYPADEDGTIFRIDWNRSGKKILGVHFLLAQVPPDKVVIYVLEVFDPKAQSKSQAVGDGVKREAKILSKSGILTGVQELVKFGVRILTGGA